MIHLLQNNEEVGSDEDGVELGRGWWFWGLSDKNCSVCIYLYILQNCSICSEFSKVKFF